MIPANLVRPLDHLQWASSVCDDLEVAGPRLPLVFQEKKVPAQPHGQGGIFYTLPCVGLDLVSSIWTWAQALDAGCRSDCVLFLHPHPPFYHRHCHRLPLLLARLQYFGIAPRTWAVGGGLRRGTLFAGGGGVIDISDR